MGHVTEGVSRLDRVMNDRGRTGRSPGSWGEKNVEMIGIES